ncbi:MAG TPA: hypothetical protein VEG44_09110 [Candidatus Acidoferrales bacterium]|nr:hypothetical protein [Candidatus Acidoferrales bacterium]
MDKDLDTGETAQLTNTGTGTRSLLVLFEIAGYCFVYGSDGDRCNIGVTKGHCCSGESPLHSE